MKVHFLRLVWFGLTFLPFNASSQIDTSWRFLSLADNLIYRNNDLVLEDLFKNLDSLILRGDRQLKIVHIGDSHIQAGFFPDEVRRRLQSTFYLDNGGRGFLFPYKLANTNNPLNFTVSYTGAWETCRSVELRRACHIGVAGMTAYTTDPGATIMIDPNQQGSDYIINRVKVFHQRSEQSFSIVLPEAQVIEIIEHADYTEFILLKDMKTLKLGLEKTSENQDRFELYGLSLESEDPGIVYSSVGVNGADVASVLRCDLLQSQLRSLEPNMVVISLGANDAYSRGFSPEAFKQNLGALVQLIRSACPQCSVILTTPGDAYRQRRYPNKNYVAAREVIMGLAQTMELGVWDFFTVMGGEGSIMDWYRHGLATYDRLHLTREGYWLQGDLFYEALMQAYYEYLDKKP
jgi:lysophospholipase L1-like esterase